MDENLSNKDNNKLLPINQEICFKRILNMTDTLDILSGKWKISILILLSFELKRFSEISKLFKKITDRTLSKDLKDLENNLLISKKTIDAFPKTTEYSITEHGLSITKVLLELREWGQLHREKILSQ